MCRIDVQRRRACGNYSGEGERHSRIGEILFTLPAQAASHGQLFASPVINGLMPSGAGIPDDGIEKRACIYFHRESSRRPQSARALTLHPTLRSSLLLGIKPIVSTELMGIVNGGNGFYVREISKGIAEESVPCHASWLEGWYSRESDSKHNDWWRWSHGNSSLHISTSQALELRFDGGLMQALGPQTIDVYVNGALTISLEAKPTLDFSIRLAARDNLVRLKVRQPGIRLGQDPRI